MEQTGSKIIPDRIARRSVIKFKSGYTSQVADLFWRLFRSLTESDVITRLDLMDKVVSNWPEPFMIVQCCLKLFGVFPTLGRSVSNPYSYHYKPRSSYIVIMMLYDAFYSIKQPSLNDFETGKLPYRLKTCFQGQIRLLDLSFSPLSAHLMSFWDSIMDDYGAGSRLPAR